MNFFLLLHFTFVQNKRVYVAYFHILSSIIFSFCLFDSAGAVYCVTGAVYWFVLALTLTGFHICFHILMIK